MGTEGGSNLILTILNIQRDMEPICGGQLRRSKGHIGPRVGVAHSGLYRGPQ